MNDGQRRVNAFDGAEWRAELESFNSWINNHNPESESFTAARRRAGFRRYALGHASWNLWARAMCASREKLETAGLWAVEEKAFDQQVPANAETGLWLATAHTDFRGHWFKKTSDLSNFLFPGDTDFDQARFSVEAKFSNAQFLGTAKFAKAIFDGNVSFSGTEFAGGAWFRGAKFLGGAGFNKARFSGSSEFYKSEFAGVVWFDRAAFHGNVEFAESKFADNAWFDRAEFHLNAGFASVEFTGDARFDNAKFSAIAWFNEARFSGVSWFDRAQFASESHFDRARFLGEAGFKWTQFAGPAGFSRTMFACPTDFAAAQFDDISDFGSIRAEQTFSLANTRFRQVPNFIHARFTEAPRLDFLSLAHDVEPGGFLRSTFRVFWQDTGEARQLSARYRALKLMAIQSHDRERERIFFEGELRARRGGGDTLFSWRFWFGVAYELLSGFGHSFIRPIGWWAATTAVFCYYQLGKHFDAHIPGYPMNAATWLWRSLRAWTVDLLPLHAKFTLAIEAMPPPPLSCIAGKGMPLVSAFLLSIEKGVLFLGFLPAEKANQAHACLYGTDASYRASAGGSALVPVIPDAVAFAGIVQALISAVLIFLFLMAMRNHFRTTR